MLEFYCQADITVLRKACQVFRREFIQIVNIEIFLESITIASACNKVSRKRFLKTDTIGLIPIGGYTVISITVRKPLLLLYMENTDGCKILHGRDYRLPELPHLNVDFSAMKR